MLHQEWAEIGATQLLQPERGACLLADMSSGEALAAAISAALDSDEKRLEEAGAAAQATALAWGEAEYARQLAALLASCTQ
jgi:hypothetical protein